MQFQIQIRFKQSTSSSDIILILDSAQVIQLLTLNSFDSCSKQFVHLFPERFVDGVVDDWVADVIQHVHIHDVKVIHGFRHGQQERYVGEDVEKGDGHKYLDSRDVT